MQGVDYKLVELRRKFREYYNDGLKRKYIELEPARKKYLKKFYFLVFIFSFLAGVYIYFCVMGGISKDCYASKAFVKLYIFYIAIACWVCSIPIFSYKKETKLAVMDRILDFWGDFKYSDVGALVSIDYIRRSELFNKVNEQEQDDAFKGYYQDVEIKVSEQKLEQIIYTSKGRTYKMIFNGILIALQLNKNYAGNTVVCGKNNWRTFLYYNWFELIVLIIALSPFVLLMFGDMSEFWGLLLPCVFIIGIFCFCFYFSKKRWQNDKNRGVQLEDVVFSKKWKVFADDQVEARYVLTPAFMERMLAVKKLFHGNRIDFSFWENNLLIAVHTHKDMFETTSLFKSALDYKKVEEVICQMYSIFSVIDELKLQRKGR